MNNKEMNREKEIEGSNGVGGWGLNFNHATLE